MKLAIPIWNARVSPVFDTACRLLLLEVRDGREVGRHEATLTESTLAGRVRRLKDAGVGALVCGAVSRPLAEMISQAGIELTPFVAGDAETVARAYLAGQLTDPAYAMPGCCRGNRRRGHKFRARMRGERR